MEEMERDLEGLDLSDPPQWAKARALLAAENVLRRQARRSRCKHVAIGLVAAGAAIVVVGTYIADAIAPILGDKGPYMSFPHEERGVERMGGDQHVPVPRRAPGRPAVPADTRKEEKEDADEEDAERPEEAAVKNDG